MKQTKTKIRYRTCNWKEYNTALINRGRITLWISPDVAEAWRAESDGLPHRQRFYSDLAIETLLCLRILFKLPLRQAQGFTLDILHLLGLDLPCPHYSTLCRRAKSLTIDLGVRKTGEPIHLLVDSTGLKVAGEGEWKTRKWGAEKRRTWIKVHIGLDARSGQIVAAVVTDSSGGDADHFGEILDSVEGDIDRVGADGAYDSVANFAQVAERGAEAIIPVRLGAVVRPEPEAKARNQVVSAMESLWEDETGDALWKQESGYHARSRVESEMFRYKRVIGDCVRSQDTATQRVEALLGCQLLNRMLALGRCQSQKVSEGIPVSAILVQ